MLGRLLAAISDHMCKHCCCLHTLSPPPPRFSTTPHTPPLQALETAADREIARKERERLKVQDALRRQQLEKLRENQNADASKGDVRLGSVGE